MTMYKDYFVLDADLFVPSGIPATPEQVHAWLADGTITQEVFDMLGPEQTTILAQNENQ